MSLLNRAGLAAFARLDPEQAHGLALKALRLGLGHPGPVPARPTRLAGLDLPNPVGIAAGFDKNAEAVDALLAAGFGFVEVGAATPRPQPGNPRPRLFRLAEDQAVINRFGFNNDGAEAIARRLERRKQDGIVGINLGANKDSDDRAADFAEVLRITGPHVDFATVNVSSPNTENLRALQGREALAALLDGVLDARERLSRRVVIFLKVAPDLDPAAMDDIADVARASGIDGLVATNTTVSRVGLTSAHANEAGGLSGAPLMALSTQILSGFRARLGPDMPIIGVGGIASPSDARAKLSAGADALQLYSALVYQGLGLLPEIVAGLAETSASTRG